MKHHEHHKGHHSSKRGAESQPHRIDGGLKAQKEGGDASHNPNSKMEWKARK